jgi:CubicO group peptidase (beta-lactamase class C family)
VEQPFLVGRPELPLLVLAGGDGALGGATTRACCCRARRALYGGCSADLTAAGSHAAEARSVSLRAGASIRRLATFVLLFIPAAAIAQLPPDAAIRSILVNRVWTDTLGIGIVVGVVDSNGARVVAFGARARGDSGWLDGNTVFEIGSVTKEITALLLVDMAHRGEVALNDPVSAYLPRTITVPERNGRITLADLALHRSGLPRMPSNFAPRDVTNPYADYSVEQLYEFLSSYQLQRDVGSRYEYSNLGYGLLGHALALRAGSSYETIVTERVLVPLCMTSTSITLTPALRSRLAVGHAIRSDQPVPTSNWDIPTLAGAGALRSTANDMLRYLAATTGLVNTPLAASLAEQLSIRHPSDTAAFDVAYGWRIQTRHGSTIIWHGGSTGGYRAWIGFDPATRSGVVVLANVDMPVLVDDIGPHLLNRRYPLWTGSPFDGR